jgi:hypothetical protein
LVLAFALRGRSEGCVLGNQEYDAGRGGGFVSDRSKALKATLSGVFPGDYLLSDPSGYFALNLYRVLWPDA